MSPREWGVRGEKPIIYFHLVLRLNVYRYRMIEVLLLIHFALTRAVKQYVDKLNHKNSPLCTVEIPFVQPAMSTHSPCSFLDSKECGFADERVYRVREVAKERFSCCFGLPIRRH